MRIKTIDVNCKEWFDKVNGNSYFSGFVTINYGMKNATTIRLPFQNGYGDNYKDMAFKELIKQGYINGVSDRTSYWQYFRDHNIIARYFLQENCKKRELL